MRVVMFPNRYKDNDKKPDYVLYISKDSEQTQAPADTNEAKKSKKEEIPDSLV